VAIEEDADAEAVAIVSSSCSYLSTTNHFGFNQNIIKT